MEFRILGPLEVTDGSRPIAIAGRRQRALLALLLLRANEVLVSDRILDELWGEQASASSQNALQAAVSRLRRALPRERLVTRPPGYLLRLEPGELDGEQFERLLAGGRAALAEGDAEAAAELLRAALSFWRGPALADFMYEPFAQSEIARLEELRLEALEERIDADLALGRHAELVAELEALVGEQPFRERPRRQLMLALYRSGRQADALELYRATRTMLLDELGLEPGPELRELERGILAQDVALDLRLPPRPSAPAAPPPTPSAAPELRKTVTVLFCDLADSTGLTERLDPEVLRGVLGRYSSAAADVVAAHGGTMEKFIGDAVMAVFGVPRLHEDDALRAIRAAVELRDRVADLDRELRLPLRVRIGIETGEVVAGDARSGEALTTGAAVTTAARLEQQASPGDILLGETTRRLVAQAVRVEPRGALALKGKRKDVTAWSLIELVPGRPPFARRLETPLVGRQAELAQLLQVFVRTARQRSPQMFTILGPAGIGKTRLARELSAAVADEATVLVGRCLSYGEGIAFWPLREILQQAPEGELRARLSALLDGGETKGAVPVTTDEIFLAARRLLEAPARERPLVLVLEDLHWAEPAFLDFVEYLATRATDAPMLLVCLARGELLEMRETWGGGIENASSLRLEPLTEEETDTLLDAWDARPASRNRVKEVAEGNPLFVEQMLAWLEEVGAAERERALPPTVEALLAARLDRLGPGEAAVVHRAAVIGRDFESVSLLELLPAEARATASRHLDAFIRKGLVTPLASEPDEGGRFRFAHALVRDAAYRMVPKRLRAELHERFADWLEHAAGDRTGEYEEILGYHLEQAYCYRAELGPMGDAERELASRAGATLVRAGLNARQRGDDAGAANLLSRGLELLPEDAAGRGELLLALAHSFTNIGDFGEAYAVFGDVVVASEAAGDRGLALEATLNRSALEFALSPLNRSVEQYARDAEQIAGELEGLGHERGLARAWLAVASFRLGHGHLAAAAEAAGRGAAAAQRAADWHLERFNLSALGLSLRDGPTPASDALRRCDEICARVDLKIRPVMSGYLASLQAMLGHVDEAWRLHAFALADAEEIGNKRRIAVIENVSRSFAETLGPAEAERKLRRSLVLWEEMGESSTRSTVCATLAHLLCAQGRDEDAERYATLAETLAAPDDYATSSFARAAKARVLAQRGQLDRAESLAHEAVAIADRTDDIDARAWLRTDLAEVLALADKVGEACAVLEEAVHFADQKEDTILIDRARARLAELQTATLHR